jgi:predicted restriction endonuclease
LLEAAHILPHALVGDSGHQVNNGLPLRADLHTLFDLGHVWVDEAGRIQLSQELAGSEYEPLRGQSLVHPQRPEHAPHPDHLAHHRANVARLPK